VTEGGEEVDPFDHRTLRLLERNENLAAGGGNFRRTPAARQPDLGV
jgi:hypothetical protein